MNGDLLLIVDMQNVYARCGKWECLDADAAAQNILRLAKSGKFKKIIFTKFIAKKKTCGVWKKYNKQNRDVNCNKYANELMEALAPLAKKNPVFKKNKYSSLENSKVLKACKKAKRVVLAGVVAECCVLATAFSLIDAGVYTLYITDAVSGLTKEKEAAAELVLEGLCPLHARLMTTQEFLSEKSPRSAR